MCADGQTLSKVFGKRAHVGTGRTDHARAEVEGPIHIIFEQLTVRFDSSELVNANTDRLTVHRLASSRQLVELLAAAFFGRIHRRHLVYPTTQARERRFDLLFVQIFEVRGVWTINSCTSAIAGIGRIAQPDDRVVLLVFATEELREPRCLAEQQDQYAGRKRIERARVPDASLVKDMTHTCNYVVRSQICWLVDH